MNSFENYEGIIYEPFTGAFQHNIAWIAKNNHHPLILGAAHRIASDVASLAFKSNRKSIKYPNYYQTSYQFFNFWVQQLLWHGNCYIVQKGKELHIAPAQYVTPMYIDATQNSLYYVINIPTNMPNSVINGNVYQLLHDRYDTWGFPSPLFGISPIHKLAVFANLDLNNVNTAIDVNRSPIATHAVLQQTSFNPEEAENILESGKPAAVIGDGSTLQKLIDQSIPQQQSFDSLAKSISAMLGIPIAILLGSVPPSDRILNDEYYYNAILPIITSMKQLLASIGINIVFDVSVLLDEASEILTINEKRSMYGLEPLEGGDTIYMQQQDFPLEQVRNNKISSQINQTVNNAPQVEEQEPAEQTEEQNGQIEQEVENGSSDA